MVDDVTHGQYLDEQTGCVLVLQKSAIELRTPPRVARYLTTFIGNDVDRPDINEIS